MQAIQTHYLPCTNFRGSRIKALCERGSITIPYPHDASSEDVHRLAVRALVAKFVEEDKPRYGTKKNPWERPFISGGLPDGSWAHVFLDSTQFFAPGM